MTGMQCEICGAEIPDSPTRIVIDGSSMEVCKNCARFGKQEDKWSPVSRKAAPAERAFTPVRKPTQRNAFRDLVEIVPEYGRKIREAREAQGLSPEELALKIKEKAPLIRKIEREEISPDDSVRKKIERELKIRLSDQADEMKPKSRGGQKGLTLGDIASIKRK